MSRTRIYLLAASALALSAGVAAAPSFAQDQTSASQTTEVVVTGQRASHRSRLNSLAPVDVVTSQSLAAQGNSELAQGLSRVAPSLNFPRPAGTDGTDNIRPAQLRGLSPDETLVLVDGKRWHSSALVNINGSAGRGSSAVDLNSIPEAALDRVEVLRDGASAQYGSDAIAGVVNLHLRQADHGGSVTASYGQYDTDIKAANSERHAHDGGTSELSGWAGFKLGSDGFLTVSADVKRRDPTSRGDIDTTVTPTRVTSRYGDPQQNITSVFLNAGKPVNETWSLYGNAAYTDNDSKSAAFFRHSNVSPAYPNGFLPVINAKSKDYAATAGLKGEIAGWASDFSVTYGGNTLDYNTLNSVNTSLTNSPTSFYDGRLKYNQTAFNADFSRPFDIGLSSPLTLAVGLEGRHETYEITAGDPASYTGSGAQSFGGFNPTNVINKSRDNIGIYADAAGNFTEKLSYDAAIRYENYSDFGSNTSGKLALRYDFTPSFALRGTLNNGFRAPSLQQEYFTSIASVITGGAVVETGTFPATSAAAQTLGAKALEPETSTSQSLGAVWHKGRFELTVDGYHIRIGNRIVLSENISNSKTSGYYSAALASLLSSQNVSSARFFLNGVTTTTSGVDIVGSYRIPTSDYGNFNLSLAWNNNNTTINKYPATNVLSSLSPAPPLFARVRQYILTNSSPENKGSLAVDWNRSQWSVSARATYYGDVIDAASVPTNDIHTGNKTLIDLSGSYSFSTGTVLTIGADNLFDTYPNKTAAPLNITSGNGVGALAFTRFSPFGFNGRYLYAKVTQNW